MRKLCSPIHFVALLVAVTLLARAADTLPTQLSDAAFWKFVEDASEPSQQFPGENFVSNEPKYPAIVGAMQKAAVPGGVYLGVGPEQNFSYIAALQPKMAFIVDIRRQNLVEHLMYRALFELSDERADFLSRLFSRKRPDGLSGTSSAKELMTAYGMVPPDAKTAEQNLQDIKNLLVRTREFRLTSSDLADLEKVFRTFAGSGPNTNYQSGSAGTAGPTIPSYATLMTSLDPEGTNWSFLATEASYHWVRDMERRNLVLPVVGDFAGPKTIRVIASYLKEHGAGVSVFYLSNVETYLFAGSGAGAPTAAVRSLAPNGGWRSFFENVAELPIDSRSVFIRFQGAGGSGQVNSIQKDLDAFKSGRLQLLTDVYATPK